MRNLECCSTSLRTRLLLELLDPVSSWRILAVSGSFCLQTSLSWLGRIDSLSSGILLCSTSSCWSRWIFWTLCPPLCSVFLVGVRLLALSDCLGNISRDLPWGWTGFETWLSPSSWSDLLLSCCPSLCGHDLSPFLWWTLLLQERLRVVLFLWCVVVFRLVSIVLGLWCPGMSRPNLHLRRLSLSLELLVVLCW